MPIDGDLRGWEDISPHPQKVSLVLPARFESVNCIRKAGRYCGRRYFVRTSYSDKQGRHRSSGIQIVLFVNEIILKNGTKRAPRVNEAVLIVFVAFFNNHSSSEVTRSQTTPINHKAL